MVGNRPIGALVFCAHGTDVDTVLVNGRGAAPGGAAGGFDREQEVLDEAPPARGRGDRASGIADRVFVDWRK